jgi:hypothetical protein
MQKKKEVISVYKRWRRTSVKSAVHNTTVHLLKYMSLLILHILMAAKAKGDTQVANRVYHWLMKSKI